MTENSNTTKRIAKNTLMLYFRQILIMIVSLYTVRVVLNTLGAEDYGIYNVVAGVVTMFGFLSSAMATASQRFFSYDIGKCDEDHLKITFSVTFQIYLLIAFIVVLLAETIGVWFVNSKLVIPLERINAANCVFQAAIFSFLLTLITTPYLACIIAHEDMNIYAYVSIIEVLLKVGIVFVLPLFPFDKLSFYGILLACVSFVNTGIYRFYCYRHYPECKVSFVKDKLLFREIISYSGWNLFGSLASVFKNQIANILLNQFFGPIVNTAKTIATQVNTSVLSFSANFSTAVRPQIIKTYASNRKRECIQLVFYGCRVTFFLMYIFTLPLVLEMDFVLRIWLKSPPPLAVIFTQLALIDALIDSVSFPIMTLAQATGKIKLYQGVVGGILLLNLPIMYIVLNLGASAEFVMIVSIGITVLAFIVRLGIVIKLTKFSICEYISRVVFPVFFVAISSAVVPVILKKIITNQILEFFLVGISSVFFSGICILFLGMSKNERKSLLDKIKRKVKSVS